MVSLVIDPVTGAHTNNVVSYCKRANAFDEFMWREWFCENS